MTAATFKIARAVWHVLPASLRRLLRYTSFGKRFMRFVPVSAAAFASSQIMLAVLVGLVRLSAGTAGLIAGMTGALVSYVLSRWAWERKGRPQVLRETIPFWAVSVGAWIFMGLVSHYTGVWATEAHFAHWERTGLINGTFFLANCLTFAARFLIFHYILFADRGPRRPASPPGTEPTEPAEPAEPADQHSR